jgi:two-component system chemotaxis sensor kinase CheA
MAERDLVNLIFLPGFSTAEKVTQFSGRGVGMDVVRTNIEKIGGTVTIDSRLSRGSTVRMKIPLTLAIIPALTVSSGGDRYAIPQVSVQELVRLEPDAARRSIEMIHDAAVYRLRGSLLPLVYLDRVFGSGAERTTCADEATHIVVLQADDRQFGLIVDGIHDTQEIVVKPLQKQVKAAGVFAGATIMGDGKVALILDVVSLAQHARVIAAVRERALVEKPAAEEKAASDRQAMLLFATQDGSRMAVPLAQVARLEEFPRATLERVGPQQVVQYRNEILPLISVSRALRQKNRGRTPERKKHPAPRPAEQSRAVPVIVYAGKERRVGLVVDEILDIAEESLSARSPAQRPGVLFTAVVQGRVTEFLDVESILGDTDPDLVELPQTIGTEA